MNKNTQNFYNLLANFYRKYSLQRYKYLSAIDREIQSFIINNFESPKMLDVGTGDGVRAFNISTRCGINNLTVIDCSKEMIKKCKKLPRIKFLEMDICNMDVVQYKCQFQIITCLWNVLGHITPEEKRILALKNMRKMLNPKGYLILDVNNRHNINQYGLKTAIRNIWKDLTNYIPTNGDFTFTIKINGNSIPATSHLFCLREIEILIKKAGFTVFKRKFVNYKTGKHQLTHLTGQFFYILKPARK